MATESQSSRAVSLLIMASTFPPSILKPSVSTPVDVGSRDEVQYDLGLRRSSKSLEFRLPTLYERLCAELENNSKIKKEVITNKRIGFYRLKAQIGAGNFSKVKLGIHLLTSERVAIKIIDKTQLSDNAIRMLSGEIASMMKLNHPNIIRLFEVIESFSTLHLVMECACMRDLQARVMNDGPYKESKARPIFSQILAAINHMHEKDVIHHDIKPGNVLFNSEAAIKVADFGLSTQFQITEYLDTFCGSPPYAAPELFTEKNYLGPPVDIWAAGITLYFMLSGRLPFHGDKIDELKDNIISRNFSMPKNLTFSCKELINGLLETNSKQRYTMDVIYGSQWITKKSGSTGLVTGYQPSSTSTSRADSLENLKASFCVEGETIDSEIMQELNMIGVPVPGELNLAEEPRDATMGTYRILLHKKQTETLREFAMNRRGGRRSSIIPRVFMTTFRRYKKGKSLRRTSSRVCNIL